MRPLVAACLFAAAAAGLVSAGATGQQPEKKQPKKAQPKSDPAANKPDEATLKLIQEKIERLREAVKYRPEINFDDAAICLKAAEYIVKYGEWLTADSPRQTLKVLDLGLERAARAKDKEHSWLDTRGKWVVRSYRSRLDDSLQPYAVVLPPGYGEPGRTFRLDVILHGRDASLTEVKFIAANDGKNGPKDLDHIQIQVYGRGNNAYRWAGEADVFEAIERFRYGEYLRLKLHDPVDPKRIVLHGFSMGGAGTWHLGLHHPDKFCVIGPGAGFTTTHGYVGNLPKQLPDYQEKCLHIYDAVDYAENAFNVPVVAYSGEIDPQKKAADDIESALKVFKEPLRFTHLVAPGLAHQMPPEWQAKAGVEYRKFADKGRDPNPKRVRLVTYTPAYGGCDWVTVSSLETTYERAVVDATREGNRFTVTTTNVRRLILSDLPDGAGPRAVTIDGQTPDLSPQQSFRGLWMNKVEGKWVLPSLKDEKPWAGKIGGQQGPIDDAFRTRFQVVGPSQPGGFASARLKEFAALWDKYFRGALPVIEAKDYVRRGGPNLVLFGDPETNPLIAEVLPKLPITWTKERLVVNGVEYDARTHVPVLIYPNPLVFRGSPYVVINSGHTFKEADLKGTNALLYPRLGDWAVIRPTPTDKDPTAHEVVAAGLFDENWQFTGPVAPGAKLEKLWSDGEFTEGPAEAPDGSIYFSDIGNRIVRFDPRTNETSTFRDPSGRSNGLKFDARGRLLTCEGANTGGNRRVSITEKDGTVRTLADKFDGRRFNSPNDLCLDAKGRVYFSDPRYVGDEKRELEHESVYRIDPDAKVTRVVSDVKKPNGLVISPDGKTLYVAESGGDPGAPRQLLAYPLNADGTVGPRKVLHDFGKGRGIDGMTVTTEGMIVATAGSGAAGGIYFFSPEGVRLGFLATPEDPNNCCFARPDRKTLYITAGKSLYRIQLTVAGAPTAPMK
jgi:sugar lactone lactonase YvrE